MASRLVVSRQLLVGRGAMPAFPAVYSAVPTGRTRSGSAPSSSNTHRATSAQVHGLPEPVRWYVPGAAPLSTRCRAPSARSAAAVSRPCWSATTAGSTPRRARSAMVATKFFP